MNSVPDHAEFTVDIRSIPEQSHQEIMQKLSGYLGDEARIETVVNVAGVNTPAEHPWIQEIYQLMGPILGEEIEPRGAPYFTDASALPPLPPRPDRPIAACGLFPGPGFLD